MKILVIIDSLGAGGAERSAEVLCDYLVKHEVEVRVLCLDQKDVGVQKRMQGNGHRIQFVREGNFFFQSKEIASFIKKGKFGLVHSILFRSNLRTRFAKLHLQFIHMESLVNTTYSRERLNDAKVNQKALRVYKLIDRLTAQRGVDHFHSITEAVKKHYVQEIKLNPTKITVVPRGRKAILKSYDEKPKLDNEVFQIINVGRQEFQKGQLLLLKAAQILKIKNYKINVKILGRNGAMTSELKEYIQTHNLEDVVDLVGFNHNVQDYLLNSHLFVFPSYYEGLGGALIEAQAAGLPAACSDIPVLHEVVRENSNAKFFDTESIDSIVKAIEFFIHSPGEVERYGRRSLENFNLNFREEVSNERMLALYKTLYQEPQ